MMNDKNTQDIIRKATVSYLRLTWFGLSMMASFVQPYIPSPIKKEDKNGYK